MTHAIPPADPRFTGLRRLVVAASCAVLASLGPGLTELAASPVQVGDVVSMAAAGAGEPLMQELVRQNGFDGPLGVAELIILKEARISDEMIAFLIRTLAAEHGQGDLVVEERDGVLHVQGRGEPELEDEPTVSHDAEEAMDERLLGDHFPTTPAPVYVPIVVNGHGSGPAPTVENAYPSGAVFGPSGGAVFIPARAGDPPSSFGRTIVQFSQYPYSGVVPHFCSAPAPAVVVDPGVSRLPQRYGTIEVHTSRGNLRVPN